MDFRTCHFLLSLPLDMLLPEFEALVCIRDGLVPCAFGSPWICAATKAFAVVVRVLIVTDGDGTAAIARAADPVADRKSVV